MHFPRCARVLFLSPFIAFLPAPVAAQDVVVTPLAWAEDRDAPDELPSFVRPPRVAFPAELRATPDIGYVVKGFDLDEKGRYHGGQLAGTQPLLERLIENASSDWKFRPGRREGKAVNTATRAAFIFNPGSAAEKIPDATPRLLDVSLVELPPPKNATLTDRFPDEVIFADVAVDDAGTITAVKNPPPGLENAFRTAAKNWRFAPARRAGQPVASEVRVPFVVRTGGLPDSEDGRRVRPRVISQPGPVYPFAMRANGMKGEVLVDFVVNIEGRVNDAFVVRSLNPSFDDPALEAVRKWRFEPGNINGTAVKTHMQVAIVFQLDERDGAGPWTQRGKPDLSKLPEQYHYDTPPRPIGTARVVYPYALLREKKSGRATVTYAVGPTGRVEQLVIGEATAPEFGRALAAAIEQFVFEPALKGGRPCVALQKFSQEFSRDEGWQLVDADDLSLLDREKKKPESIALLRELDSTPLARSRRPPLFPKSLPPEVTEGKALVEFLIDQDGRARLPRVVSASEEAFGYAAVQSIASWRFEPVKRGGKTVVARVQIPLAFIAQSRDPAAK